MLKLYPTLYNLLPKIYDGIYWILRDYYYNKGSQYFVKSFGSIYENYIEYLFNYYLKKYTTNKIVEDKKNKRADWYIETDNYLLVIEQKSCLCSSVIKSEYPPKEEFQKYFLKLSEAYIQIDRTIPLFINKRKKILGFILHYEELMVAEFILKDYLSVLSKDQVQNKFNCFMINTDDFETLLQVLDEDQELFNNIIEEKIRLEELQDKAKPKEFSNLLEDYRKNFDNRFLAQYDPIIRNYLFGNDI